jgi:DNA polymerase III sliding clamp (beta) subunit (PCNA family)
VHAGEVGAGFFKEMIQEVVFAAYHEASRPNLTGVHL